MQYAHMIGFKVKLYIFDDSFQGVAVYTMLTMNQILYAKST